MQAKTGQIIKLFSMESKVYHKNRNREDGESFMIEMLVAKPSSFVVNSLFIDLFIL